MTTQHCPVYVELMGKADELNSEWNALLDHALLERQYERIDKTEYYRLMGEVTGLQEKYVQLRDQAIDADHWFWMGHIEDDVRADEWRQQHYDERPE